MQGRCNMSFQSALKHLRQVSLLTQEEFAKEIGVAFSTVNRWEMGKTKPNISAMKKIRKYCIEKNVDYSEIEKSWLSFGKVDVENGKER